MNGNQPDPIPDRARLHRQYLWKKATAEILALFGAFVAQGIGGLLLLIAILIPKSSMIEAAWCLISGVVVCYAFGGWLFCTSKERSLTLIYCPRPYEPNPAVQSDDVLLRGSNLPGASPHELLRAANTSADGHPDELLRPDSTRRSN